MIAIIIVSIIICAFITFWITIACCSDSGVWIFDKDRYRKDKVFEELQQIHDEVAELKNKMNEKKS